MSGINNPEAGPPNARLDENVTQEDMQKHETLVAKLKIMNINEKQVDVCVIYLWLTKRYNPYRGILGSFHSKTPKQAVELESKACPLMYKALNEPLIPSISLKEEKALNTVTLYALKHPDKLKDDERERIASYWKYAPQEIDTYQSHEYKIQMELTRHKNLFTRMHPLEETAIEIIDNIEPVLEEIKKEITTSRGVKGRDIGERLQILQERANEIVYLSHSTSIVLKRQSIKKLPKFIQALQRIHESEIAGSFLSHFNDTIIDLEDQGFICIGN